MNRLNLYYSISNGGDGSAYPKWSLDEVAADLHQEIENEFGDGWGEPCTGVITVESESPITVIDLRLITKESLLESMQYYLEGGYRKDPTIIKRAESMVKTINESL